MAYTTINKSSLHFNTLLQTGNDASPRSLTGVGFQPDLVWLKRRNSASSHTLYDAVRTAGSAKGLASNANAAEGLSATEGTTANYGYVNSFDSDGFSVTTGASNDNYVNNSSDTYVSWNWKANGQGSSNTDGSINTTYTSANTTAGISIVQYTGTGSNATIGHGLGIAPQAIFVKKTNTAQSWRCGHVGMGWTHGNNLNNDSAAYDSDTYWQDTAPTTSVFSVGTDTEVNGSGDTHIAYCFAEVRGFSKFGSYTGNGNDKGPFIFTGFKPAFVIIKKATGSAQDWIMIDNKRGNFNSFGERLYPNLSSAEDTSSEYFDFISNGFVVKTNTALWNNDNSTYVYWAFAEAPLVGSNNVPATAR